ncbi:hypothetical protein CY34DRAFT_804932 [Suillus luteus UH-Slu-Lm8-n1]|uniref:Uncharacterized protein n=1 Tax=Suillus luteus UH-Slu-Lm8-n1 TaxID=930992 RepID=A0A0C9ZXE3_9AGAM|nr:hypothetical protein CY34DRAFT_804932 [Suillus luteus UH-Slu-Lm8-n1]
MFSRRVRKAEDHGPRISNEGSISATAHACDEEDQTRPDQTRPETIALSSYDSNQIGSAWTDFRMNA